MKIEKNEIIDLPEEGNYTNENLDKNCNSIEECNNVSVDYNTIHEKDEANRNALILNFNEQGKESGVYIDKDVIPTEDDVIQCKKDWEDYCEYLGNEMFCISDEISALDTAKFLADYNRFYVKWSKDIWLGVIAFDKIIQDIIRDLCTGKLNDNRLMLDYNGILYLYTVMSEPFGIGLESAIIMEKNYKQFNNIFETIKNCVDIINEKGKHADLLQTKWALAAQGFDMKFIKESK